MKPLLHLVLVVLSLSLIVSSSPADEIDNPQFNSWNKFGVGSSAVLEGKIDVGPTTMTMTTTRTLKEKADDHVVIEITAASEMMGRGRSSPPISRTINKTTDKKDVTELGNEKVEAAGKTYDCKVYEMKGMSPQSADAKAKVWFSPDVPGGVVKMEVTSQRGNVIQVLKSVDVK